MANRLCGFFPRTAASDEAIFLTGLVELLEAYPLWVLEKACNVRSGLPAYHKFMPALAEIREHRDGLIAFEHRHTETMERYSRPKLPPPDPDRSTRPTYDELKAKYGPNWGIGEKAAPQFGTDNFLGKLEAEFGAEKLASVPNHRKCPKCGAAQNSDRLSACADRECPMPWEDKRMAAAKALGRIADAMTKRAQDDFDAEFGT